MMVHPLLLHAADAYRGPTPLAAEDVEDRVLELEGLDRLIRTSGDMLRREEDVYWTEIQPGVELYRALFEKHPCIPEGVRTILTEILGRSRDVAVEDFEGDPPRADMGLWPTDEVFLARTADWYRFRRETLGACGVTEMSFSEQANRLFPSLVLSSSFPACLKTLEGGFNHFLPSVIDALTALNDDLLPALGEYGIVEGLKRFSAVSGFETTMEGSADRNNVLTFDFPHGGASRKVICAPHVKLSTSGVAGDGHFYFNRIYFNPHQEDGSDPKIHIGHVGGHL